MGEVLSSRLYLPRALRARSKKCNYRHLEVTESSLAQGFEHIPMGIHDDEEVRVLPIAARRWGEDLAAVTREEGIGVAPRWMAPCYRRCPTSARKAACRSARATRVCDELPAFGIAAEERVLRGPDLVDVGFRIGLHAVERRLQQRVVMIELLGRHVLGNGDQAADAHEGARERLGDEQAVPGAERPAAVDGDVEDGHGHPRRAC